MPPLLPLLGKLYGLFHAARWVRGIIHIIQEGEQAMKGYKTVTFNVGAAIVALGSVFGLDVDPATAATVAGIVIPLVNIALRAVTDSPIFRKM